MPQRQDDGTVVGHSQIDTPRDPLCICAVSASSEGGRASSHHQHVQSAKRQITVSTFAFWFFGQVYRKPSPLMHLVRIESTSVRAQRRRVPALTAPGYKEERYSCMENDNEVQMCQSNLWPVVVEHAAMCAYVVI